MAVELLIKANSDYVHSDPVKDLFVYKKGDIVLVKEIPHPGWGLGEGLPTFCRLIISNATIAQVNNYIQASYSDQQKTQMLVRRAQKVLETYVDILISYMQTHNGTPMTVTRQQLAAQIRTKI